MLPNDGDNDECATKVKADGAIIKETFESLCRSIVNTTVTYDGWWKARFNCIAARTLMDLVSNNCDFLSPVSKVMGQLRKESAQFLISLPSRLEAKSKEASESPNKSNSKANAVDKTYLETWLLDRFYFDQADKSTVSVVERVCYLNEKKTEMKNPNRNTDTALRCWLQIPLLGLVLFFAMICASWALACLSLDAFCTKLSKFESNAESPVRILTQRWSSVLPDGSLSQESVATDGSIEVWLCMISFMGGLQITNSDLLARGLLTTDSDSTPDRLDR
eukprot:scaffold5588_cov303-Alexandrium_tamarense.AAC.1